MRGQDVEPADKWLTHPVWGIVFLAGVLGATFWLTFNLGMPIQGWLETAVIAPVSLWVRAATVGAPSWVGALLVDGVLAGAGTVVTFAPVLAVFFTLMSVLEDSGYMARAAVITDRYMHRLGLHGKSFLPLFVGFGCSVPAVLGSRTIEWGAGRLITVLLAPIVPCAGRLAVLTYIAAVFFGEQATYVVWGMIVLALLVLAGFGLVLSRLVGRGDRSELVMELPAYRTPDLHTTGRLVRHRLTDFLWRAGTLIVVASAVVWAASYFPDGALGTSYLARFGKWLEPVGMAAGLDWRLVLAALTGLVAKENAVATLGIIYAGGNPSGLAAILVGVVSPASAVAFMAVVALFLPCVATMTALWRETAGHRLWMGATLAGMAFAAWAAGAVVYRIALLLIG